MSTITQYKAQGKILPVVQTFDLSILSRSALFPHIYESLRSTFQFYWCDNELRYKIVLGTISLAALDVGFLLVAIMRGMIGDWTGTLTMA